MGHWGSRGGLGGGVADLESGMPRGSVTRWLISQGDGRTPPASSQQPSFRPSAGGGGVGDPKDRCQRFHVASESMKD